MDIIWNDTPMTKQALQAALATVNTKYQDLLVGKLKRTLDQNGRNHKMHRYTSEALLLLSNTKEEWMVTHEPHIDVLMPRKW